MTEEDDKDETNRQPDEEPSSADKAQKEQKEQLDEGTESPG